ncbi:hypothetical protein PENTCL1PPCAC_18599, partial [Pristionchus entomophagus]
DNEEDLLAGGGDVDTNMDNIDEEKLLNDDHDEPEFNPFQVKQEELDLFDAAIEPSGAEKETTLPLPTTPTVISSTPTNEPSLGITTNAGVTFSNSAANIANITGKKFCCYIGNMTWWTTDDDLVKVINSCGPDDLVDLKFYENRLNGQSKGFCLAVFLTDQSVRTITEKLPLRPVHGQTLVVLPYSKISLARLEEASAKSQTRIEQKKAKEENGMLNMGTIRIGAMGITPMGPGGGPVGGGPPPNQQPPPMMNMGMMGQRPPMGVQMGGPMMGGPMGGRPGGPSGPMNPQQQMIIPQTRIMPGGMVQMGGPPPQMQQQGMRPMQQGGPPPGMSQPPPGMAPRQMGGGPPPPSGPPQPLMGRPVGAPPNVGAAGFPAGAHINPNVYPGYQHGAPQEMPLMEGEVEEVMNRNRTISSSAISRAISDATSGNHADAIETLLTAISLIKQSRCAADERCKLLISSLHDTLSGIEAKMKERKRDRRDRSRSRSRERKHRRRSRSRSPRRKY